MEHKEDDSEKLHIRMNHAKKLGLIKAAFGQFANYFKNPGEDAGVGKITRGDPSFKKIDASICVWDWWD